MSEFEAFHGTTDQGAACWVMNLASLAKGEPAYNVKMGKVVGHGSWFTGHKPIHYYGGKTMTIARHKITRARHQS